jgi:AcrR family transcriptional regulator
VTHTAEALPKQDPIQAQLAAARRNQILDAATRVFAARGFHNSTIRQIAGEAGVADGTIYLYFKNKTDLLIGLLNRLNESEERPNHLVEMLQGDVRTQYVLYLRQRFALLDANFQTLRAILPEILADEQLRALYRTQVIEPTFALAEPFVEQWVAKGGIRPISIPMLMRSIVAMVLGALVLRLLGDELVEAQWQQLPELLSDLLFVGIEQESVQKFVQESAQKSESDL